MKKCRFRQDIRKKHYWEGGEALEQALQKSSGHCIPGIIQGQVKWGFEQSSLIEGVPAHGKGN